MKATTGDVEAILLHHLHEVHLNPNWFAILTTQDTEGPSEQRQHFDCTIHHYVRLSKLGSSEMIETDGEVLELLPVSVMAASGSNCCSGTAEVSSIGDFECLQEHSYSSGCFESLPLAGQLSVVEAHAN